MNHLDPNWLRQKYEHEGRSTYDIAKLVGRDNKSVYKKLIDFGVPTRPRGLNLKGADNFMAQPGAQAPFKGRQHSAVTRADLKVKASIPKPWLRGTANGMYGCTGAANPNYKGGSSTERQRFFSSPTWRRLQHECWKRDDFRCQRCHSPHRGKHKLHAHHIVPWSNSVLLRLALTNLITLCKSCHNWVHSRQNVNREFLRKEDRADDKSSYRNEGGCDLTTANAA